MSPNRLNSFSANANGIDISPNGDLVDNNITWSNHGVRADFN